MFPKLLFGPLGSMIHREQDMSGQEKCFFVSWNFSKSQHLTGITVVYAGLRLGAQEVVLNPPVLNTPPILNESHFMCVLNCTLCS